MIDPVDLNQNVKMFKNGHSYAFRISKKDREFLGADTDTQFAKILSPNGKEITFKKIEKPRSYVVKTATQLYENHSDLMKWLGFNTPET